MWESEESAVIKAKPKKVKSAVKTANGKRTIPPMSPIAESDENILHKPDEDKKVLYEFTCRKEEAEMTKRVGKNYRSRRPKWQHHLTRKP